MSSPTVTEILKAAQRYEALKSAVEFGETAASGTNQFWAMVECGSHPLMIYAPTLDALTDLIIAGPTCPICAEREKGNF